ncbi:hypothetical protein [Flavobacterium sp.]
MKKRLEAELISIAHRILKLKNKSEVDQLYKETQKLYETLSVLKFYQDNFESVKSDVAEDVLEEKLEQSNHAIAEKEPEVVKETVEVETQAEVETAEETEPQAEQPEEAAAEAVAEEVTEEAEAEATEEQQKEEIEETAVEQKPAFEPIFELELEDEEEPQLQAVEKDAEVKEEKLEDHIGRYVDPVFVKPEEVSTLFPSEAQPETREEVKAALPVEEPKTAAMNEVLSKSIAIGLNDRIGFVNHLFNGSNEDFNRVISQLNTFDTFEEAKTFINEMVIPDYNYWVGEEDYIERFMAIVEKKFQ